MLTEAEVIRQFLDLQYGEEEGTAWISVGAGRSTEKTFSDNAFQWPAQREEIVAFIVARNEAGYNVWFAAHLSYSKKSKAEDGMGRAKGSSVKRRRLHVDIDRVLTDADAAKIRDLDAWVVYSGSPGHVHAYIELEQSVDVGTYHRLEDLLVTHFGSDQAVCRDNGLLRIPGTINQMSEKKSHPTAMVTWDGRITGSKWTPADIERIIGVEVVQKVEAKTASHPEVDYGVAPITPVACQIPKPVLDAIMRVNPDRSAKATTIINTCKANYLTLEETYFCLLADPEQVQRLNDKGPRYMFGDTRKMYGSADEYNPEMKERADNALLFTTSPPPLQYQEPPRQLSAQEQDDADTAILMGMVQAQQQYEQQQQPGILTAEQQLQQAIDEAGKTWTAMDYEDVLDGSYVPVQPTMFTLQPSGISLIYPGEIHSFFGEPGSAKSLLAQIECINQVKLGMDVLYIDFEDDKGGVISRLLEFGGATEEFKNLLRQHLVYVRPREAFVQGMPKWESLLKRQFALCILDGVTESMSLTNHELNDNSDVAKWIRIMPGDIRDKTGAAVIMIDHVTKSRDGNNRMALGGGHKLAAITGAAYVIEQDPNSAVGRGAKGVVVMRLSKDRPGFISGQLGAKKNGLQEAARIIIDSTGDAPIVTFGPHQHELSDTQKSTSLRRLVFDLVAHNPGWNKSAVKTALKESGVRFKDQDANGVIDLLVAQMHLRLETVGRAQQLFVGSVPMPQETRPSVDEFLNEN